MNKPFVRSSLRFQNEILKSSWQDNIPNTHSLCNKRIRDLSNAILVSRSIVTHTCMYCVDKRKGFMRNTAIVTIQRWNVDVINLFDMNVNFNQHM